MGYVMGYGLSEAWMTKTLQTVLGHSSAKVTLDVPSVRIRRRRIDAGTTSRPYGVSPSPQGVRMHPTLAAGPARGGWGVDYWQSMSKGGVENGVPMGRRGDRMAHRIRIHDNQGGSRHGKGMRRPLRTAIAVIVATAMLTPTIASAAPVVPDAPSPVPGVESSSLYADDGVTYTADGRPLYESASDTIYIYNAFQTAVSRQDDAADQPVLTGDGDAETFGTGQPIYAEGSDEPLTYSPEHTYAYVDGWDEGLEDAGDNNNVVVSDEPEAQEESDAEKDEPVEKNDAAGEDVVETEPTEDSAEKSTESDEVDLLADGDETEAYNSLSGRDYVGQVTKEINGTTYILIGNKQQLRAIGSNKDVVGGEVYRIRQHRVPDAILSGHYEDDPDASPELVYRGDADLQIGEELRDSAVPSGSEWDAGKFYRYYRINGSAEEDVDERVNTRLTYGATASYIIFRDIDLSGSNWTPLMFSGKMIGAKATDASSTGNLFKQIATDGSGVVSGSVSKPVISGLKVEQDTKLNPDDYVGIGFFGTISSETDDFGMALSDSKAVVSNLSFKSPYVTSSANELDKDFSVIGALLQPILDLLLGDNENLTNYATGILAGRVVGQVSISGIEITNATIDNTSRGYTGGIAGYVTGSTQYDGISDALGGLAGFLKQILNLIPGLGLGDLIDILLGSDSGLIQVGKLIPIGYVAPVITGCTVDGLSALDGAIGNTDSSYAGGLVGYLVATTVSNCEVKGAALSLTGKNYVGGFAGAVRNGSVDGALDLDSIVDLKPWDYTPQSIVFQSKVTTTSVKVKASGDFAGGFAGGLANAYMINDVLDSTGSVSVSATGDSAGGFAGVASLGWQIDLGKRGDNESNRNSLLSSVNDLLSTILTGQNPSQADPLLALVGIKETVMLGVQVKGTNVTVSASNNAGGLLGEGSAPIIASTFAKTDPDNAGSAETYWESDVPSKLKKRIDTNSMDNNRVTLSGLTSVTVTGANAGGVAGKLDVASGGGLIDSTLGLTNVIPFVVSGATVTGSADGFSVSAGGDYAAGGIGRATGGEIYDVSLDEVKSVTGANYVGGFMGASGSGSIASSSDGLNLLGLNLVKVNNLLSVGAAIQTKVDKALVDGISGGLTISATGNGASAQADDETAGTPNYSAGGFVGLGSATEVKASHVTNLGLVTSCVDGKGAISANGEAGGFVGRSTTAGLADVGNSATVEGFIENGILNIDGLLGAITYLLPTYTDVDVSFVGEASVKADSAGGFAGVFESGTVDNTSRDKKDWFAVYNLDAVNGGAYAGGFGGNVYSGALADAAGGVSILGGLGSGISIDISKLLNVLSVYIPTIKGAGVKSSERGLAVSATALRDLDAESGSAGGFIGYGSGVQVSSSDVDHLRHTTVTEPADLEGQDGSAYFSLGEGEDKSSYAVTAARYAGGYIGYMNIGSAASVGKGLGVLGNNLTLNNIAGALQVVASTIEHSDAIGAANGFAVLGSDTVAGDSGDEGHAGGFAGKISGGHIQDSNCRNFSYVIGQVAAGGYAGEVEPGNVADVLDDVSTDEGGLLHGLIGTEGLASVLQAFVPSIRNSETTCIPCGGAVRAQASSDATTLRGMAGGYVGHNVGGQIWGNSSKDWKDEDHDPQLDEYTGPQREAAAVRIRSVYGAEYAGGFTGLMEAGDTASTGSLGLLWDLVSVDNLLGALGVAYPTEENTAVYGPLAKLDVATWNAWVKAVGKYGGYGASLATQNFEETEAGQAQLDELLAGYLYGMNVVAGRSQLAKTGQANAMKGGSAGGYVGAMVSGTITNGQAHDVKLVQGMRAAGGFAGIAESGGAATLGSVSILGVGLNLGQLLEAAEVFVPVIKNSSVEGYRLGMTVASQGAGSRSDDISHATGNAGGYIGYGAGVQIWGDGTTELGELVEVEGGSAAQDAQAAEKGDAAGCNVANLRRVVASAYAGGYAGRLTSGSTANVNTDGVSDGFIQGLLDAIIGNTGLTNLVSVLQATMSTVRGASVSAADEGWGFTIEAYRTDEKTTYPLAAGGFVGLAQATVMGERNATDADQESAHVTVNDLRGVEGGLYSGGFVGLAETGGVAEVAGGTGEGSSTSLLDILKLGSVEVIQAFQPFIYDGTVNGVADGVVVSSHTWDEGGLLGSKRMSGNAGGFAGTIMGGEVLRGTANNMNSVSAPNYAGGFVGYTGKTGIADVEDVSALKQLGNILGLTAGVANVIGTTVEDSTVTGIPGGYTVASQGTAGTAPESGADSAGTGEQIAGGFAGYADLAHITNCDAGNLKLVRSAQAAGGFAGKTSFAYLISAEADSSLVEGILKIVNALLDALYTDKLQNLDVLNITLPGEIGEQVLSLKLLSDGTTVSLTLLGIHITVALDQVNKDNRSGTVVVTIGDSEIKLECGKDGLIDTAGNEAELTVNLIKGNRSEVTDCSVTGIAAGYDVFGGGATQASAGLGASGYAGGFVGHNNEGKLTGNKMLYADVVSGTAEKTGPFTGVTSYNSTYWFNNIEDIDQNNTYHVYRDPSLVQKKVEGVDLSAMSVTAGQPDGGDPADQSSTEAVWARFDVSGHRPVNGTNHVDWKNATVGGAPLGVYASAGKAVLMDDAAVSDNTGGLTPEPGDGQDPCETLVNVTIQKVWNDGGNRGGTRPESITVKLTASYTDANQTVEPPTIQRTDLDGKPVGEPISNPMTVKLSAKDASAWSETWRKVVKDLPVAFRDEDGTLHYYTYTASEVEGLGGKYTVSYETDSKENVITITNSLPLPETGGMGTHWFAILGILLVGVGILLTRKDTYGRGTGRHRAAR